MGGDKELLKAVFFTVTKELGSSFPRTSPTWDILSALRGPDAPIGDFTTSDMKSATTCVIRSKLGFEMHNGLFLAVADTEGLANIRRQLTRHMSYHFVRHARNAFEALGLKWDEVNE